MNSFQLFNLGLNTGLKSVFPNAYTALVCDEMCYILDEMTDCDDIDTYSLVYGYEHEGFVITIVKNVNTSREEFFTCLLNTDEFEKTVRYL